MSQLSIGSVTRGENAWFSCWVVSDSCDPMDREALSMYSPGENTEVGCHFPSPGDLPYPGNEPGSPALQADSLLNELQVKSWGENIVCLLLWLLHRPGERLFCVRLCYGCCYHCCISQERVIVSSVPTAPPVFFQPRSLCLAYPGFSGPCEKQDDWSSNRMIRDTTINSISDINDIQLTVSIW